MKRKLFINTGISTASSLLARAIGMGFSAYLSGRIGPEGVGLFQLMMSVYYLAVNLAASGMRMASVRAVSEASALGKSPRRALHACLRISGTLGLAAAALLYILSGVAADAVGDLQTEYPLRALALALPFVAMSSTLGGYLAARRRVAVYSAIQSAEQVTRIALTVGALAILPPDNEHALLALAFGITASEAFSFLCSFTACIVDMRDTDEAPREGGMVRRILRVAMPDALGSWLRSGLSTAEQMLVPKQLEAAAPAGNALATYGLIQGMALPVIAFPMAPVTAMAGILLPEVARMHVKSHAKSIRRTVKRSLAISLIYSSAIAAALFLLADTLAEGIYHNAEAALYIRAFAPLVPLLYTDSLVDHLLKGLDQQLYCVRLNTADCLTRVLFVLFILPMGGVGAYIALLYVSEAVNFIFSVKKLYEVT